MATKSVEYPYGLIAGGMIDGTVNIWDPARLASDHPEPLIACIQQHQGAIFGLQFNPHRESSHLLSSGGSDGEVYVMALERPEQPNVFIPAPQPNNAKHTAAITKVAWNTQVIHILASASQNGSCIVWDLRQKKAWCELRDPTACSVSDICWNPDQGLHLVTASGDDKNPVIKLWDLRSSTSLPLATLQGHSEGILSMSWCPNDPSLLLSCGKDNRTLLWDIFNLQSVYELPCGSGNRSSSMDANDSGANLFGNLASVGNRRYNVSWSPCLPAVVSTCAFDRSVQFYSLSGVRSRLGRAPKWLRKPVGATFGFGGKLASFDNKLHNPSEMSAQLQGHGHRNTPNKSSSNCSVDVKVTQVIDSTSLLNSCNSFQEALARENFNEYCVYKAESSPIVNDRKIWSLMKVINFEKNAREELLTHLGFNNAEIEESMNSYKEHFGQSFTVDNAQEAVIEQDPTLKIRQDNAEPLIRQALVVGNFSAAVDICIEAELMTEALLLAQCGDPSLWMKTQSIFFEKQKKKYPFITILQSVIKSDLMNFVQNSDLSRWKETLAVLSTYGKSEEFPSMCETLGSRLETEMNDPLCATLCYMCATNIAKTIDHWLAELENINNVKRTLDIVALQEFMEKVVIYTHASQTFEMSDQCGYYFAKYASLLASQGKLDVALQYLKGNTPDEVVLRDRLYHAGGHKPAGSRPPPFPFAKINVVAAVPQTHDASLSTPYGAGVGRVRSASQDGTHNKAVNAKVGSVASHAGQQQAAHQSVQHSSAHHFNQQERHAVQQQPVIQQQQQAQPVRQVQPATTTPVAQPAATTPAAPSLPSLPAGWLQLVDPSSNRPYFVNQASGQSQWEPPAPAPVEQFVAPTPTSVTPQPAHFVPQMVAASPQVVQPVSSHPVSQTSPMGGGNYIQNFEAVVQTLGG